MSGSHAGGVQHFETDCLVIGAGVVGLAIARRIAQTGREVIIVESENRFGTGTSSRSSEVIHAGLYYAPDSLRAVLCVAGKKALYKYCAERSVSHNRCGKLVVATDERELETLEPLIARSRRNGVHDVRLVDAMEARAIEPNVGCVAAIHSPSSGVIDSHELMVALLADARAAGAELAVCSPVISGIAGPTGGATVQIGGSNPAAVTAPWVVNAAGLGAWAVARSFTGLNLVVPDRYLAKGTWFAHTGKPPFRGLVYPLPNPASLGVHSCLDMAGEVRFGPDLEWVDSIDYGLDAERALPLYEAIRKWFPALKDGALTATYSGIRPKVQSPTDPAQDWWIHGPDELRVPGNVQLLGMESPALTSCLAIADHVVSLLE